MNHSIARHESLLVGLPLACVGGFLDAYTYVLRGGVFANAQTGNLVLLALRLAQKDWPRALYYALPVLAFCTGILVVNLAGRREARRTSYRMLILGTELLLLLAVGFLPAGAPNALVTVIISFVCSLQVHSFRTIHSQPYATTMCTGNLRSATDCLFRYLAHGDRTALTASLRYYGVILAFCGGAALGGALSGPLGIHSVWFCCAGLLFVLLVLWEEAGRNRPAGQRRF